LVPVKGFWLCALAALLGNARSATPEVPELPGTTWAASYYYYHEDWHFLSADTVAVSAGQWGWSFQGATDAPVTADGLYMWGPDPLHYRIAGPHLIVDRYAEGAADTLTWDGEVFRSDRMLTYGHVVLLRGGNADCRLHE
jgi:hypothetical protein